MRPLLICCLLLWASPLSAEEPPQEDLCALLAKRLDEAPGGPGTKEHQAHGRFLLSQCIAQACFGSGVNAEKILTESENYQAAWAQVKATCLSSSRGGLPEALHRSDARAP